MKVLDIYPRFSWSFAADDEHGLSHLRAVAEIKDEQERLLALNRLASMGHAYSVAGDAVDLDFSDRFFDEINVIYAPGAAKSAILTQKALRWLKESGMIKIRPAEESPVLPDATQPGVPMQAASPPR